jgi:hypothetical protein
MREVGNLHNEGCERCDIVWADHATQRLTKGVHNTFHAPATGALGRPANGCASAVVPGSRPTKVKTNTSSNRCEHRYTGLGGHKSAVQPQFQPETHCNYRRLVLHIPKLITRFKRNKLAMFQLKANDSALSYLFVGRHGQPALGWVYLPARSLPCKTGRLDAS